MSVAAPIQVDLDGVLTHRTLNHTLPRAQLFQRGLLEDRYDAP